MPKVKHDRSRLKLEYFSAEELSAQAWIRRRFSIKPEKSLPGNISRNITGRSDDKKDFINRIKERALQEAEDAAVVIYRPSIEELGNMHKNLMTLVKAKIASMAGRDISDAEATKAIKHMSVADLSKLWEMVKTEKGEPTRLTKNENDTTHHIDTRVTDEEQEIIDALVDNNDG